MMPSHLPKSAMGRRGATRSPADGALKKPASIARRPAMKRKHSAAPTPLLSAFGEAKKLPKN